MTVILIRSVVIYLVLSFSLRVMGKRQLGELQPSELAVTILVSNISTLPLEDTNIPLIAGVAPTLSLMAFEVLLSYGALKSRGIRKALVGSPVVVICDGVINVKALGELRMSTDDLMTQLREKDVFDVREVLFAAVETNGALSLYKKWDAQEVTAGMAGIKRGKTGGEVQFTVISDGKVLDEGLARCNLKRKWLDGVLLRENKTAEDIFLMTSDKRADYYIVEKEKK